MRRTPSTSILLFLLFLLSGGPAVVGNEGGAAGSCRCLRSNSPPGNVQSIAAKLQSWERCGYLVRFIFPKRNICGLDGEPWVEELKSLTPSKRKGATSAEASKEGRGPTPISRLSPPAQTSTGPPAMTPTGPPAMTPTDEPPRVQPDPHFTTATLWVPEPSHEETPKIQLASDVPFVPGSTLDTPELTSSPRTAGQGAAGVGPSHFAPQSSLTQHTKIAVPVLLAITLLSVAIMVFLLCRKKRQPCRRAPATPLPPQDPGEETLMLRRWEET